LLGEQMFNVEYDDTKRRCKRKLEQRENEELNTLVEKLFNGAHRGAEALVFLLFDSNFFVFFSDLKHTKFELNWMEGVAWRNLQRFSMNIKAGHEFKHKHLEAEFGKLNFPNSAFGMEKWM
jgi:hypothetical protein